jgi:putative transposase
MPIKRGYVRHLPHFVPQGVPIFLTWNLKGAMPRTALESLRQERRRLAEQSSRRGEASADRKIRENKILFAIADRFLDRATDGPTHLADPNAAEIVEESVLSRAGERYDLFAWCVMSNHVHVLLTPWDALNDVTKAIKGYTAFQINGLQDERGRVFWQDESYDHWVRDEEEMFRIIEYIENNPVAASLCGRPEEWPRSSARFRKHWQIGDAYKK